MSEIEAIADRILAQLYKKPPVQPAVLDSEQAAAYLSTSPATIREWRADRRNGFGPKFIRKGGFVRYRIVDLDAWLQANEKGAVA